MKPHILFIVLIATFGCSKPNNAITGGGKGGNATLTVTPEHHGEYVDSCTVYIKYGTNDKPSSNVYDDSVVCVLGGVGDTTPVAVFNNLKVGLYYLYGSGYHPSYHAYVKGGIPWTISKEDNETAYLPTN